MEAANTGSINTGATPTCGSCSRPKRHRSLRRRPRQLPVPALVPRHRVPAGLRRRQTGRHAEPLRDRFRRARGRRARVRCGASGLDRPAAHGRRAPHASRPRAPALAAARLRAPRPLCAVREDECRRGAHRERLAHGLENTLKVQRKLLDALLDEDYAAQTRRRREAAQARRGRSCPAAAIAYARNTGPSVPAPI